jgi:hypothetical protein
MRRHFRTVQTEQPKAAALSASVWPAAACSPISTRSWKLVIWPRRFMISSPQEQVVVTEIILPQELTLWR